MQELTSDLIKIAKEKLASGAVQQVIGWRRGLFDEDVTPSTFKDAADLEKNFVFNKYCKANLSKYLVKITRAIETAKTTTRTNNAMAKQRDPNAAEAPIPNEKVLAFLKPGDTHSFCQLLKENRITRDDVYIVAVPCSCEMDESVKEGEGCDHCRNKKHVVYDEVVGKAREEAIGDPSRFEGVEKIAAMSADERHEFWKNEFSRAAALDATLAATFARPALAKSASLTTTICTQAKKWPRFPLRKASTTSSAPGTSPAAALIAANVPAFVRNTFRCIFLTASSSRTSTKFTAPISREATWRPSRRCSLGQPATRSRALFTSARLKKKEANNA